MSSTFVTLPDSNKFCRLCVMSLDTLLISSPILLWDISGNVRLEGGTGSRICLLATDVFSEIEVDGSHKGYKG